MTMCSLSQECTIDIIENQSMQYIILKITKKNHMVISIEALLLSVQKVHNRIQYPFLVKSLSELGIDRVFSMLHRAATKNLQSTSKTEWFYSLINSKA